MKKFEPISKEEREAVEEAVVIAVKEQFQKEKVEDEYYQYDVILQNIQFRTYMSHEELEQAATYAVDILEEMKSINNKGVNRIKFEEIKENADKKINSKDGKLGPIWQDIEVMHQIRTKNLDRLVAEIAEFRRVGGAYWLLMSQPCFLQALYAVYDVIVDRFDEVEESNWYDRSAFFLMRAIMRVRSEGFDKEE